MTALAQDFVPDRSLSQWWTPEPLARKMAERFLLSGDVVLDPCAGPGAFRVPISLATGCRPIEFEIDPRLTDRPVSFLAVDTAPTQLFVGIDHVDCCVMNPPYERGMDSRFIAHAFDLGIPRVIALVRLNVLCGRRNYDRIWSRRTLRTQINLVKRPDFGGDHGPRSDYVILEILAAAPRGAQQPVMEWWEGSWC